MTNITIAITSCWRLDLLKKTLFSISKSVDLDKYEKIITEDTKNLKIIKKVKYENEKWFLKWRTIIFTWENSTIINHFESHKRALEILYDNIKTEYAFHCEDDWYFRKTEYDYIELSKYILENNKSIWIVWLRSWFQKNEHNFLLSKKEIEKKFFTDFYEEYYWFKFVRLAKIWQDQEPFLLNPWLRRTNEAKKVINSYKWKLDEYYNWKVYADMWLYTINILPWIYEHMWWWFRSTSFFKDWFIKSLFRASKNAVKYYYKLIKNKRLFKLIQKIYRMILKKW